MFPDRKFDPACLYPVTLEKYNQWVSSQVKQFAIRQMNLNTSYQITHNFTDVVKEEDQNETGKFYLKPKGFCFRLELEHEYYGIQPIEKRTNPGFSYDYSICICNKRPSFRFQKQMKYKTNFESNMIYATSSEFKKLKHVVEKKVIFYRVSLQVAMLLQNRVLG